MKEIVHLDPLVHFEKLMTVKMVFVIYLKFERGWLFTFVFLPVPSFIYCSYQFLANSYHCIIGLFPKIYVDL